jgi:SMI1 / KNR4 family (SUKH-1)
MTSEIDLFREHMIKKGYKLGQPATEAEIVAFEADYEIVFPTDVREYFLKINGVDDGGGFIELEPLGEWCLLAEYEYSGISSIRLILKEETDLYFRFGHYDISVWDWSIRLDSNSSTETPIIVTFRSAEKVVDNFTEFLHKWRTTDSAANLLGGY